MQTIITIAKFILVALITILMMIFSGCKITKNASETAKPVFNIHTGLNTGGITENTDIIKTNGVAVDAFTGATNSSKTGFNLGASVSLPVLRNSVETGIDLMFNNQAFTYKDNINNYYGYRKIDITQIMLPLTYNFGFFKKNNPMGAFQLKIGGVVQYNILNITDDGVLPTYNYNHFSAGATIGFKLIPVKFNNHNNLGFYLDGYRGGQIYKDLYNQSGFEIPGSSYMKAGILFEF